MQGKGLIFGAAINDVSEKSTFLVNGKRRKNPVYARWITILTRCLSKELKKLKPTYEDCTVCESWLLFSNFKKWMESQDWVGKEIDKDLLFSGNKVYSPETCLFVTKKVNMFVMSADLSSKRESAGACYSKRANLYEAYCQDPFAGKRVNLGFFKDLQPALDAHKAKKMEFAKMLIDQETDPAVADALRRRFSIWSE